MHTTESLAELHRPVSSETVHPSFGAVLQKYRRQNGATQTVLAEMLGTTRNTITNWESGRSKPDLDTTIQLCAMFGIPVHELLGLPGGDIQSGAERRLLSNFRRLSPVGQNVVEKLASTMLHEEELARDDLLRNSFMLLEEHSTPVAAGNGCEFNNEPPEYFFVRKNGYNEKADAVVRVSGASMEPLYHNGDLLYIQYADYADDGEDVVCSTADGAVVKRLKNRKLYSLNKELPFGEKNEDDHVRVIGRVLGVVSSDELPNEDDIPILEELMSKEIREFCERHRIE